MQGETNIIIKIIRNASRSLQRDYMELEYLKSSQQVLANFVQRAMSKLQKKLTENLGEYYKNINFNGEKISISNTTQDNKVAIVELIDSPGNFARALPFFGIMVTIVSQYQDQLKAERSVFYLPIFDEVYFAEQSQGTWLDKHSDYKSGLRKLRIPNSTELENPIITCDPRITKLLQNTTSSIMSFNSDLYNLSLLLSGKIDATLLISNSRSRDGIGLFIKEAVGFLEEKKGLIIISNLHLRNKITQLIA